MKTNFACLLALTLIIAFAGCGGESLPAIADAVTIPAESATTESVAKTESTTEYTTTAQITTTTVSAAAVPTDTAGIIRYYNDALAKTAMRRTSYNRSMTKITGFAKALGIPILDDQNLEENPDVMPYVHDVDNAIRPSDLVALEAGWVAHAESRVKGEEAVLTITLKNHATSPDLDPKAGTLGYISTLDKTIVVPLVSEVAMALAAAVISPNALKRVDVLDSSFGLSDGKYAVTIDVFTRKIKSLTFTATQYVEGNAKCVINIPLIPASAIAFVTLWGNLTAVYAPK